MNEYGNEMKALYPWLQPNAFDDIDEHRLVYAFPHHEMELNNELVQNEGY